MSYTAIYKGTEPVIRVPFGSGGEEIWTAPTGWPVLPTLSSSDQKFVGLYGVENTDGNFVAVLAQTSSGTYTVDWGDGVVENVTSNTQANHVYNFASLTSAPLVNGLRIVQVTITATTANLTRVSLQVKHNQTGLPTGNFVVNWLDIAVNGTNITALSIGGNTVILGMLQRAKIGSISSTITTLSNLFLNCASLQSIEITHNTINIQSLFSTFTNCHALKSVPFFNTQNVTNFGYTFNNCYSLLSVPLYDTSKATSFDNTFNGCRNLQSIPAFNTAKVTNFSSAFANCSSLLAMPQIDTRAATIFSNMFISNASLAYVPPLNATGVTSMNNMFTNCATLVKAPELTMSGRSGITMNNMFQNCYALQEVPKYNTSGVTNMSYMFQNCFALTGIPDFDTRSLTNMDSMFYPATSLQFIPYLDTSKVTNVQRAFAGCTSLKSIGNFNFSAVTTSTVGGADTLFSSCRSLSSGTITGLRLSVSYSGCKLSRTGILEIFSGLGTASGASGTQTVNVASNWGSSSLTAADRSIAANKGWAIIY